MQEFLSRLHRDTHKLPCRCWGPAGTDEGQHLRQWRNSITNRLWWYWQQQEVAGKKPLFWLVSKRDLGAEDFKRKVHIRMGDNRDAGERILHLGSRDCTVPLTGCASSTFWGPVTAWGRLMVRSPSGMVMLFCHGNLKLLVQGCDIDGTIKEVLTSCRVCKDLIFNCRNWSIIPVPIKSVAHKPSFSVLIYAKPFPHLRTFAPSPLPTWNAVFPSLSLMNLSSDFSLIVTSLD